MFAYIKGVLAAKGQDYIVVETGSIGYRIVVPTNTFEKLNSIGSEVKMHTYLNVREDGWILFGFLTEEELKMFEQLIKVSGVGPKVAMSVVSVMHPSQFGLAVLTDDVNAFVKAPGIGKKTAMRIIFELKDKLKKEISSDIEALSSSGTGGIDKPASKIQEAISALIMLGYSGHEANSAVSRVFSDDKSLEDIIRDALKSLVI
ncbi:MAG: Holliday junction branch migration protein RuvA [Bacillota bacterium]|jgi:Holliday junction DNA helicase RuvA|nr:Holliday junction branch migration protein RuvA [Bacillota bacterium]NLV62091.1 Holliday junction branch migration protein RuvA [Clostridiaceae bacterium]